MQTVYIETSVISYLTSRPSPMLVTAAHQQMSQEWWDTRRLQFDVFVSPVVIDEISRGNTAVAKTRLEAVKDLPILTLTESAQELIRALIAEKAFPTKALDDAAHVAIAAVHSIDYLLTWNCRHIDNAETKPTIRAVCSSNGYACPEICTPQELMGAEADEG